jgi:head-tail adaptor
MSAQQPVLNRRLVLEARRRDPDGAGGFVETWEALGVHWAEVSPRRGRAQASDALPEAVVPVDIVVRAMAPDRPGRPRPDHRFREGARVWRIDAVTEADPAARFLVCHARQEEVSP